MVLTSWTVTVRFWKDGNVLDEESRVPTSSAHDDAIHNNASLILVGPIKILKKNEIQSNFAKDASGMLFFSSHGRNKWA
jgi:hypothetical protein